MGIPRILAVPLFLLSGFVSFMLLALSGWSMEPPPPRFVASMLLAMLGSGALGVAALASRRSALVGSAVLAAWVVLTPLVAGFASLRAVANWWSTFTMVQLIPVALGAWLVAIDHKPMPRRRHAWEPR